MYSERMNQRTRIYEYMREHGGITTLDAMYDLGVTRLSGRIFDLRKSGVEIGSERVTVKNRYGEDCSVVRYRLRG